MRLAVTGHRGLAQRTVELVQAALRTELGQYEGSLVGLSCIADGADALFARAVLDQGGSLVVIVPAVNYRDKLPEEHHAEYDDLLGRASDVVRLDFPDSTSESHMVASVKMVEMADKLVAVWDGKPARGYGGTADVVNAARDRAVPVTVIWPDGAERD
ncbi:hypothetical protein [Saccharopolyspora phatthalungensis]|uniref:DNA recombination-mediator protein A n=1 Tax=Saccharopolyspora phatthalungensis TaxID=664693 RepID=A0A840QF88_9PSEU|nr:hypothetical protein [Saccharopolyspora phatthalungensis]MBB5158711.1 hypothetical protein [Saccharopolyspora phatthalungensis]MBB5158713.1 hypothetical protein [Saccharopolyspora phatthalungensis]MBB5158715.1 hypothetical protein [Saccharopolyspora phatthalungensis]